METWLRDDLGERKKRLKSKIEMGGLERRERENEIEQKANGLFRDDVYKHG